MSEIEILKDRIESLQAALVAKEETHKIEICKLIKKIMSKFKVGDIVPYRNTRGNIKKAEITSFETVDNGKVWFHGIDTDTKAKVWYPLHISEKIIQ